MTNPISTVTVQMSRTHAELRSLIGKIPETYEEKDAAFTALVTKYVHEGMSDAERATVNRLKTALDDLGPLPHTDPEWLDADRYLSLPDEVKGEVR
jgi:hypothetical protein